ncbi:MAG: hypothetical protein AB9915_03915 [Candidatus Dojkabacteria bacterium]
MTHYISRFLSILVVIFFGIFILEGFSDGFNTFDSLSHLFLTVLVLLISLGSWKWPKIGGWLFAVLGLFFMYFFSPFIWAGLLIGGVVLIAGVLFLLEGFKIVK